MFQPEFPNRPFCEDSIFNAAAGIGGKPGPAGAVKGVHRLDQADGADADQVILIPRQGIVFLGDVGHQPQVVADDLFPGGGVPRPQGLEGGGFLPGGEGPGKTARLQMEGQVEEPGGEKLQQLQQHGQNLPWMDSFQCMRPAAKICPPPGEKKQKPPPGSGSRNDCDDWGAALPGPAQRRLANQEFQPGREGLGSLRRPYRNSNPIPRVNTAMKVPFTGAPTA